MIAPLIASYPFLNVVPNSIGPLCCEVVGGRGDLYPYAFQEAGEFRSGFELRYRIEILERRREGVRQAPQCARFEFRMSRPKAEIMDVLGQCFGASKVDKSEHQFQRDACSEWVSAWVVTARCHLGYRDSHQ